MTDAAEGNFLIAQLTARAVAAGGTASRPFPRTVRQALDRLLDAALPLTRRQHGTCCCRWPTLPATGFPMGDELVAGGSCRAAPALPPGRPRRPGAQPGRVVPYRAAARPRRADLPVVPPGASRHAHRRPGTQRRDQQRIWTAWDGLIPRRGQQRDWAARRRTCSSMPVQHADAAGSARGTPAATPLPALRRPDPAAAAAAHPAEPSDAGMVAALRLTGTRRLRLHLARRAPCLPSAQRISA